MKKSILNAINSISSNDEMNEVIELIKIKQKQLRAIKAHGVKASLFVGAQVRLNSRKGVEYGEVTKINRTKAVVNIKSTDYNVPMSIMEVA